MGKRKKKRKPSRLEEQMQKLSELASEQITEFDKKWTRAAKKRKS